VTLRRAQDGWKFYCSTVALGAPHCPSHFGFDSTVSRYTATCGINYAAIMSCFVAKSLNSFYESVRINYIIFKTCLVCSLKLELIREAIAIVIAIDEAWLSGL